MIRISSTVGRWLAAASACTLVGAVAPATASATPPPALPAGYAPVVDDTQTITVAIPATWTDVDTAPVADETGAAVPQVAAAPNIESFVNSFDTPGVRFMAFPFTPTPQALIDKYGLTAGCTSMSVQPYSDPVFTGLVQVGTSCGTGAATWNMVVASPATSSHTVVVQVQTATAADQQAFDTVLATFNFAAAGVAPAPLPGQVTIPAPATPTAPAVPTVPAVPVPAVAPAPVATAPPAPVTTGIPASQGIALTDDSGLLTMQVPASWTDVSTDPTDVGDAQVVASPNFADVAAPYVILYGAPYTADTQRLLGRLGDVADTCVPDPVEAFDARALVGHSQVFRNCDGTDAFKVLIVASPASQSATICLVIAMPSFDEAALDLIVSTFNVTR